MCTPLLSSYDPDNYNPYKYQNSFDPSRLNTKKEVDEGLRDEVKGSNFIETLLGLPRCIRTWVINGISKGALKTSREKGNQTEEHLDAIARYQVLNTNRSAYCQGALISIIKYPGLLRHPMTATDRLGNPEITFPIALVYGDQDFMSSEEGPEDIVKGNMHFESGRSQIFLIKNCGHNIIQDQPDDSFKVIHGFFEGTLLHHWEPKKVGEFNQQPI